MTGIQCPLCTGLAEAFAPGKILGRHVVEYRRCLTCRSVFLPSPHWLDEAYASAISALDTGLLERCLQLANVTGAVLHAERLRAGTCLDFAGGYGTLTRLMRDRGFAFHHHDPLCENIFAVGFEATLQERYSLVTAFEVLEHLPDPRAQLADVAATTDVLLLTTQVLPDPTPLPGTWDYYAPQTGQHVTFSTVAGLRALAGSFGMTMTTSGRLVHAFHRRQLRPATRALLRSERLAYLCGAVAGEVSRRRGFTAVDSRSAADGVAPRTPGPA